MYATVTDATGNLSANPLFSDHAPVWTIYQRITGRKHRSGYARLLSTLERVDQTPYAYDD